MTFQPNSSATVTGRIFGASFARILEQAQRLTERLGRNLVETADSIEIPMSAGKVQIQAAGENLAIAISCDEVDRIHPLREIMHFMLDQHEGAKLVWDHVDAGSLPPNLRIVELDRITRISPNFYRVRVRGDDLRRFGSNGLHFRLVLPPLGREPVWPRIGVEGRTVWPSGEDALHRPVYTTRAIDPEGRWLDFDVYYHEGGRVSTWCGKAEPGTRLALSGPSGAESAGCGWNAFFGDETALPAIARMLADLPADARGHAFVELGDLADRQDLAHPEGVALTWLRRGGGRTLFDALSALEVPQEDRYIWFATERAQADAARDVVRNRFGLSRKESAVTAYWAAGATDD